MRQLPLTATFPMNSLILKLFLVPLSVLSLLALSGSTLRKPLTPPDRACLTNIPTAISPNGDGINDAFSIEQACELESFRLEIFDQSQQLIFESRNIREPWDGMVDGVPVPEGAYPWTISYRPAEQAAPIVEQGELVLVR